jgi:hypothetical protein
MRDAHVTSESCVCTGFVRARGARGWELGLRRMVDAIGSTVWYSAVLTGWLPVSRDNLKAHPVFCRLVFVERIDYCNAR